MGLHRSYTLANDKSAIAESKRHAFWSLYTIDKNVSLNMGLTSHFPDHDIDADVITPSDDPRCRPWDLMSLVIVEFASIQGRVYDELYSAAASKASDEQRWAAIDKLSSDLITVRDKLLAVCSFFHASLFSANPVVDRCQSRLLCGILAWHGCMRRFHCLLCVNRHLPGADSPS